MKINSIILHCVDLLRVTDWIALQWQHGLEGVITKHSYGRFGGLRSSMPATDTMDRQCLQQTLWIVNACNRHYGSSMPATDTMDRQCLQQTLWIVNACNRHYGSSMPATDTMDRQCLQQTLWIVNACNRHYGSSMPATDAMDRQCLQQTLWIVNACNRHYGSSMPATDTMYSSSLSKPCMSDTAMMASRRSQTCYHSNLCKAAQKVAKILKKK